MSTLSAPPLKTSPPAESTPSTPTQPLPRSGVDADDLRASEEFTRLRAEVAQAVKSAATAQHTTRRTPRKAAS